MILEKRDALLWAFLSSPLIFFLASTYSDAPNQIHWTFNLVLFAFGILLASTRSITANGIGSLFRLLLLYFGAFYIVSFWEQYPGTTVIYGKFELINVVIALNAFLIGRNLRPMAFVEFYSWLGGVIIILTSVQIVIDSEQARHGYGIQLMLCLPAALMLGKHMIVFVGIAIMLASQQKATLAAAFIGLAAAFLLSKGVKRNHKGSGALAVAFFFLSILAFFGVSVIYFDEILRMVARLFPEETFELLGFSISGEGVDESRERIARFTWLLIPEYFLKGMGYMNFYVWEGMQSGSSYINRLGREVSGTNLHSSYATWVLEGGLLVAASVCFIGFQTAKKIRNLLRSDLFKQIGVVAVSWCFSLLLIGAYHQVHSTMQFWATIGLIFGFAQQAHAHRSAYRRLPA